MNVIDTPTAAAKLGISHAALRNWLKRHPNYRPSTTVGINYVWTEEEIEAVRRRRVQLRSRKRTTRQMS